MRATPTPTRSPAQSPPTAMAAAKDLAAKDLAATLTLAATMALVAALALAAAVALAWPTPASAQRPDPEVFGVFEADTMYTLLPPDAIPAIRDPQYVRGAAARDQMDPEEVVMGVALDDQAVAWSTWHLDRHEIVNDHVGGRAIAATW